jgi:predicted PurR-regulated permease PerM
MKFFVAVALTALLSFASALFFPWWIIGVAAFLVALVIPQKALAAFLAAFVALFILWVVQSLLIDSKNDHLLSSKVAALLPLGGSYVALVLVSGFIGGLVAGMSALTASFLPSRRTSTTLK